MHRNLENRIEAVTPIEDRTLRGELWEILQIHLTDQRSAWDMQPDGTYVQRHPGDAPESAASAGSHKALIDRTCTQLTRPAGVEG
jgi:polyphosphate kinase